MLKGVSSEWTQRHIALAFKEYTHTHTQLLSFKEIILLLL